MGLFSKLFGNNEKANLTEEELLSSGTCPNCWGRQEYQDQFKEFVNDPTKANISHSPDQKKAFVQQFVETNITGIRLKSEGEYLSCPSCKGKYKYVSEKAN